MIEAQNIAKQGDVVLVRVYDVPQKGALVVRGTAIPEDATPVAPVDGKVIVTHSETGHHHVIDASDVIMYQGGDPLVAYLRLESDHADLIHLRSNDTHAPWRLGGGVGAVWEVRRQREWDPAGERRAAD